MPEAKIIFRPGIDTQKTPTLNEGGWSLCNLIRWRNGLLEKLGGWHSLVATSAAGRVRFMHAWEDLQANVDLGIGGDAGLQIYQNGVIYNTSPAIVSNLSAVSGVVGSKSMASTATSTTVTVTDASYSPTVGQLVTFPNACIIGGIYLPGGTVVTVTGSSSPTWTFALPTAATDSNGGPFVPYFLTPGFPGQTWSFVNWNEASTNHTFVNGQPFTVTQSVVSSSAVQPINIPPGNYMMGPGESGFTQTNFSINTTVTQGGTTGSPFGPGYEGSLSPQFPVNYVAQAYPASAPDWYLDNLGANLLFCWTKSAIYVWQPPIANPITTAIVQTASQINNGLITAMPQAQVIAWGTETVIGNGIQDPLLLRWSDAGGYTNWTAAVNNQAGSFRLSRGSQIVGAIQAPQTTLVFTDVDVWAMSYVGPPFVYSFTTIGSGCGLIAPHAVGIIGLNTYWMSTHAFWVFTGGAVQQIPCSVWDIVFDDLDFANQIKCFVGENPGFNEIFFFYPSLSGGTGECDSYVKYNTMDNLWDYGKLTRSAWIGPNEIGPPLGADGNSFVIMRHEEGYNNDLLPMTGVFAQTGFVDQSKGSDFLIFDQVIPDFKWFGSNGSVNVTAMVQNYPGDPVQSFGPYSCTPTSNFLEPRGRGRQIAFRFDWAPYLGFSARLGATRVRSAPNGRHP